MVTRWNIQKKLKYMVIMLSCWIKGYLVILQKKFTTTQWSLNYFFFEDKLHLGMTYNNIKY